MADVAFSVINDSSGLADDGESDIEEVPEFLLPQL